MPQQPLKILQASAGSGKTFSLTAHYLTLLLSGENKYREILAVTFTNKATEEMKSRILDVLQGFATGDEKFNSYRNIVLNANPTLNADRLKEKADKIYRKILHDYSRFSVSTIDGFVQKVIRGFAFELGLDAGYSLEMNYDKVKDDLVAKLDEALDHNRQLLQWIIDLAIERINDNKSWNYKTELYNLIGEIFKERFQVFEEAIEAFGDDGIDELFKQYISITKAATKSFEEELTNLAIQAQEVFNQFGVEKEHLNKKSVSPLAKIPLVINGDFSKIESLFNYIDEPEIWFQKNTSLDEVYQLLNPILKNIKDYYLTHLPNYTLAIAFSKNLYYLRLMQEVASLLKVYRQENDNLLISDAQKLITGITDDAGDNPSFIWEKVGTRYRNFLFDEFQDTSTSQWNSFRSLLTNAIATPTEEFIDHLIVGDTKQSIYRWRNGDWNILHRQAKFDIGAGRVLEESLEENYRSAEHIITFNNYIYKKIPDLLQEELNQGLDGKPEELKNWWQEQHFDRVITDIYSTSTQQFAPNTAIGGTIKLRKIGKEDAPEELRFTETIFRDISLNEIIVEIGRLKSEQGYVARDIAILVRSNTEAITTVKKLMDQGIDVISGEALLIANNLAVQLIVDTMKALIGLDAETALYKANCIALYNSLRNVSADANHYLNLNHTSFSSLSAVLPASLCASWQSWMQLPLPELVEILMESYGLSRMEAHLPYLLAFRDLAGNATRLGEKGIVAFLNWWDEEGIKKSLPSPESADAIQVITIHKSKGLAFRAVFIPFCNWEIKGKANSIFWVSAEETAFKALRGIPLKYNESLGNSAVAKAYYEELLYNHMDALNMLYVATTRARDYLYIATMAKKDPARLGTIGDVLNRTFENDFDENNTYEIIDEVPAKEAPKKKVKEIELDHYPTTSRLAELYVAEQEQHAKHMLNIQKSGRRGSLLHDVLANVANTEEVDNYLEGLALEGLILEKEKAELRNSVLEVLNHADLQAILNKATQSITEKSIIDAEGKMHRPDRVLISADEVIILDYKFTLQESQEHITQVLNYKTLFTRMGYSKVSGYLFYAVTKQLKSI
ncbi:ATP-dependent exoDNAse (exonuclease V) beta subunit [Pedobacter sp. AK017]|uniref:UvrD-helicase domain-containing protein n=1 Tax=Pedobacter sp. AK017 TaxID=2723073 RepID=UPI00161FD833|nr:UvrD-helicase domain-containing protein [Pedobacter sp. AK017]MBB5437259.1 ATP-dependent exoDNAse (exonuclease V) beta subunit [Pedobacter sp. AK017]